MAALQIYELEIQHFMRVLLNEWPFFLSFSCSNEILKYLSNPNAIQSGKILALSLFSKSHIHIAYLALKPAYLQEMTTFV